MLLAFRRCVVRGSQFCNTGEYMQFAVCLNKLDVAESSIIILLTSLTEGPAD